MRRGARRPTHQAGRPDDDPPLSCDAAADPALLTQGQPGYHFAASLPDNGRSGTRARTDDEPLHLRIEFVQRTGPVMVPVALLGVLYQPAPQDRSSMSTTYHSARWAAVVGSGRGRG